MSGDPLYDLLAPALQQHQQQREQDEDSQHQHGAPSPAAADAAVTSAYLARLTTLPLEALTTTEPQSLAQSAQSSMRSLQALSKRSHKAMMTSAERLSSLRESLPALAASTGELHAALPPLESAATSFAAKHGRGTGGRGLSQGDGVNSNAILDRRRRAMLLSRNIDRVADILELPTLLSSAISTAASAAGPSSSQQQQQQPAQSGSPAATTTTTAATNYASALDLHAHIRRLASLYPNLTLVRALAAAADREMRAMTTQLVTALQSPSLKLAAAMRTVGWLRRSGMGMGMGAGVSVGGGGSGEGALGALLLVCRLANLVVTLEALAPLRELADQETARRDDKKGKDGGDQRDRWAGGQQTERYLKRYIEIFREQSFAIVSMYRSIFPAALPTPSTTTSSTTNPQSSASSDEYLNPLLPLPSPLAAFPLHLVDLLASTLRTYLPNVRDRSSRDSLLTQVLYCAGSLGRLGGDFGLVLAMLEEQDGGVDGGTEDDDGDEDEEEWVEIIKKHRVQASRLELLASGVGTGRNVSGGAGGAREAVGVSR
ncbi:Dor1-like family-domain-containing protein [Lineolata rhizophorae]|uniref:Conserved oligomeric Golgi complex subunit 8 n=1 Tax=Lineolata rhizophorae TaxID=578093 RepID=A0A6A6P4D8_9PEZI|nr:Dor1-like family-domain-containing protein [Lineolata rhizophorae]